MERYQTKVFTLNMLETYTKHYVGCSINVDDGYIYLEWKDQLNPSVGIYRKYFVQYYNIILCVPADQFEAHYRNIQYFVDDLGQSLDPVITGPRPSEEEHKKMIDALVHQQINNTDE